MSLIRYLPTATLTAGLLLLIGCGGSSDDASTGDPAAEAFEDAARSGSIGEMQKAAAASAEQAAEEGLTIEQLANPERLRSFLPETLAGMQRNYMSLEEPEPNSPYLTSGISAMYGEQMVNPLDRSGRSLDVSITDAGSMKSMLGMIRDGINYDRDGETARSFEHEGFQGLETTSEENDSAELQIRLPERLLVSIGGRNIDVETLHEALGQLDLTGLAALAESGTLASLTEWQKVTLPAGDRLGELLPETIGQWKRGDVRVHEFLDSDPPHIMVQASYSNEAERRQQRVSLEVTQFKSPEHASRIRAGGRDGLGQRFGGFDEDRMEYLERTVHGAGAEVLLWGSNAGVGRVQHDRTVIMVSGPADAEALLATLQAIDPAAIDSLDESGA